MASIIHMTPALFLSDSGNDWLGLWNMSSLVVCTICLDFLGERLSDLTKVLAAASCFLIERTAARFDSALTSMHLFGNR
jgi:hypothetical protein